MPRTTPETGTRILLAEDEPKVIRLLQKVLRATGFGVMTTSSGEHAVEMVALEQPDLVILDIMLTGAMDGFEAARRIREFSEVPILMLTAKAREADILDGFEAGTDDYLTKPFSTKELKYKARQLIARYRGISSWIMNPSISGQTAHSENTAAEPGEKQFTPYPEFAAEVDKRVKVAMNNGAPFSIVGCRLPHMTADGGRFALRLFEIVRGLARDTDLTTTNPHNDLVMLLVDAGALGARSFAGRLRTRVKDELQEEPKIWMRSFPDLEVPTEAQAPARMAAPGVGLKRRAGDQATEAEHHTGPLRQK
jgi:DNA-binding response OmpR family regulator